MSAIDDTFAELRQKGEGAYVPYVCSGDPDLDFTLKMIRVLDASGADIIELGLPFSDPIADGPVIQEAMKRSLKGGFKISLVFDLITRIRAIGIETPLVVMSYYNPLYRFGVLGFCEEIAERGANALLVVDVPPEESRGLREGTGRNDLDLIRLITPTTPADRVDFLLSEASGFAYLVSVAGTTGHRSILSPSAESLIRRVAERTPLPICLGFGISEPGHVRRAIKAGASGVVEGSKIISLYSHTSSLAAVKEHATLMKSASRGD